MCQYGPLLFRYPRPSACLAYNLLHTLALLHRDVAHDILCVLARRGRIEVIDVALAPLALGNQEGIIERRLDGGLQKGEPGGRKTGRHQQDAAQILELAAEVEQPLLVRRQSKRLENGRALREEARLHAP